MKPTGQRSAGAVSNQYQILGHLATGGMAELFIARAVATTGVARHVVLKRIMADCTRNHRFVTMFLDEARLAAQLNHPNVAQVHDIGRIADSYFFTMEYVHGENVRNLLHRVAALKRQIPLAYTLTVIAGAAAGLHYAHEKRGHDHRPLDIVHRNVSPSNLMVAFDGAVKLVDFGIAKAADRMTETRSGAVKGKVSYMSPEQCTGSSLDRRSDIFSLGVVLYEMATMTRLFKYGSDFETMNHIVNLPVPPPTSRRPDLPRGLEDIILKALAHRPEDRHGSAGELRAAIEQFAARERLTLSAAPLGSFVRELFGDRPEPWHELEATADPSDVVTVDGPDEIDRPTEKRRISIAGRVLSDWQPDEVEDADDVAPPPVAAVPTIPMAQPAKAVPPPVPRPAPSSLASLFDAPTHVVPNDAPLGAPAAPPRPGPESEPPWRAERDASWPVALDAPPVRRRRWLWTAVAAIATGVAVFAALLAEPRERAGSQPAGPIGGGPEAVVPTGPVAAPAAIEPTPVIEQAIEPPARIEPPPLLEPPPIVAEPAVAPPDDDVADAEPAPPAAVDPAADKPRAQPPRSVPARGPRIARRAPVPAPAPVRCGDAMGIYPPCE